MSDRMLLVLAGVAGSVDAASYLGLGQVFTANMTGNTVLLGLAAGQGHWAAAGRSGIALAGFCAGVGVGGARTRRAFAIEAVGLAALAAAWAAGAPHVLLIAIAALAMGLQSAAVARLDTAGTATTYLTGTITTLLLRVVDRARGVRESGGSRGIALPAAVLPVYAGAALVVALGFDQLR